MRLGDRAALILALSPVAVFILIAVILIVGPRLSGGGSPTGTEPSTVTAPTLNVTQPAQTETPTLSTATPVSIIIHGGDFIGLN